MAGDKSGHAQFGSLQRHQLHVGVTEPRDRRADPYVLLNFVDERLLAEIGVHNFPGGLKAKRGVQFPRQVLKECQDDGSRRRGLGRGDRAWKAVPRQTPLRV